MVRAVYREYVTIASPMMLAFLPWHLQAVFVSDMFNQERPKSLHGFLPVPFYYYCFAIVKDSHAT